MYGLTIFKNLDRVCNEFCSKTRYLVEDAINFLTAINNLRTFIRSNALALDCNVFCPQTQMPPFVLKFAIGLIRASYNESRWVWLKLI